MARDVVVSCGVSGSSGWSGASGDWYTSADRVDLEGARNSQDIFVNLTRAIDFWRWGLEFPGYLCKQYVLWIYGAVVENVLWGKKGIQICFNVRVP